MKRLVTTLAALTIIVTPAFAQSFDLNNGTGSGSKPTAPLNDKTTVLHSGIRAYAMVPHTLSARVTRR